MSAELEANLTNYKVQLAQVEAALSADPENEELKKLKQDLEEVIQLTKDLMGVEAAKPSTKAKTTTGKTAEEIAEETVQPDSGPRHMWKVGDPCYAIWSGDGKYHKGVLEEILPESATVAVRFDEFEQPDVCQLTQLKLLADGDKAGLKSKASKRELMIQQREYRKKKNQRKKMRAKEKEAESEISKHKWKEFNKKITHKSMKGAVKKSIFASPEGLVGRVGIGTCGTADKDMTKYDEGAKYNARHLVPKS
uniref:survival of motor neuron-related-splicing factor 30-like n=1 Tax=Styela clava TaxID=7725 RepID=UPI00193A0F0D|nr:survival of motor neuron-related-splicing factor 30-like [Styela clava]